MKKGLTSSAGAGSSRRAGEKRREPQLMKKGGVSMIKIKRFYFILPANADTIITIFNAQFYSSLFLRLSRPFDFNRSRPVVGG
jgi:hypothetical protein